MHEENRLKVSLIFIMKICRPFITTRDGRVIYAFNYGLKAFCFEVDEAKQEETSSNNEVSSKKVD